MPNRPTIFVLCLLMCGFCLGGCGGDESSDLGEEVSEQYHSFAKLKLTTDAQRSIGLETIRARHETVQETISTTAWLQTRPGDEVIVRASATGFYLPDSAYPDFRLGSVVEAGRRFGSLQVFVSPQEKAQLVSAKEEADILIEQAKVTRELAEAQLKRLQADAQDVVAGTRLIELEEIVHRSRVAEQEGRDKLPFLPKEPYEHHLDLQPVALTSPMAGRITKVHVSPRQLVIQGDPLWTIGNWNRLWARVPVFESDLPLILRDESARISVPGKAEKIDAQPVDASQPTEAGRRTVDVYYEIENTLEAFRPGQSIPIMLPTGKATDKIVIPQSAVVWDGMGNPWVYVKESDELFRRQRVEVVNTREGMVVKRGLMEGDTVVSVGAQALYGEEFEGQIQVDDDD